MSKGVSLHVGVNEVDSQHYRDADGNPWTGRLYGCENDADAMAQLASSQGLEVRGLLKTAEATSIEVTKTIRAIAAALDPGDMFLLTFSGHGGQVANLNPRDDPESDDLDETWCLYDRQLLDDELFEHFAALRPGVRIVVFSDSCHSGTVTRAEPGVGDDDALPKQLPIDVAIATERANQAWYAEIQAAVPTKRRAQMHATVVLLSGCQDDQFSRDGRVNGAFTAALLKAWDEPGGRISLRHLFEKTAASIPPEYQQHPNYTVYCFDTGRALMI